MEFGEIISKRALVMQPKPFFAGPPKAGYQVSYGGLDMSNFERPVVSVELEAAHRRDT